MLHSGAILKNFYVGELAL